MDIPTTEVIRHWSAWGPTQDCPDEHREHSVERAKQFDSWLFSVLDAAWQEGYDARNNQIQLENNPVIGKEIKNIPQLGN
jgi:hypothetical protein